MNNWNSFYRAVLTVTVVYVVFLVAWMLTEGRFLVGRIAALEQLCGIK